MGNWKEDWGTRRIGDKGKDLFQVLTSYPLVPLPPDLRTPPHPNCVTIENCNKKNIVKVI
ncbi:hypothetical protein A6V25_05535 [Nostoc sp. ATCC 53789]|nr:hypothetical protein A6V25_05535 [Nostoc sp. ATCC 53789]